MIGRKARSFWIRFWMKFAGLSFCGRMATRLAILFVPPYYERRYLARLNSKGYIAPSAAIHHKDLKLGPNVFIDDRVLIFQAKNGGAVEIGERVRLYRDTIIQNGDGGTVKIADNIVIQPRCQFSAYKGPIEIARSVQIAPNCAFYSYNHGYAPNKLMSEQELYTKGGIYVDEDAWLGFGVIVLDGVRIGKGAIVGAGSVVTNDIADAAIAVGAPARVVKMRSELVEK